MSKPVTPQEMFDLWQKMVNPGAYPLQSLMFPVLDPKELEKKISELETVEHWLKANLNMLQLTIKSLQYQRAMLKGGEKFRESLKGEGKDKDKVEAADPAGGEIPNPAMWAWNMMAEATKSAAPPASPGPSAAPKRKKPTSRKA